MPPYEMNEDPLDTNGISPAFYTYHTNDFLSFVVPNRELYGTGYLTMNF